MRISEQAWTLDVCTCVCEWAGRIHCQRSNQEVMRAHARRQCYQKEQSGCLCSVLWVSGCLRRSSDDEGDEALIAALFFVMPPMLLSRHLGLLVARRSGSRGMSTTT